MILPSFLKDSLVASNGKEEEGEETAKSSSASSNNNTSSSSLRRYLTTYFDKTGKQEEEEEGEEMDYYYKTFSQTTTSNERNHTPDSSSSSSSPPSAISNAKYSFLAGTFQGLGAIAIAGETLTLKPKALTRMILPGFLAFETHYNLSHALYKGVFNEEKRPKLLKKEVIPPIGVFENVLNYELHICAGAMSGLVYSFANKGIRWQLFPWSSPSTSTATATNMLGFAALFGSFDVYSDLFRSWNENEPNEEVLNPMAIIGLAGGCASMTQAWMIGLRRSIVSSSKSLEVLGVESRYAAATHTTTTATTTTNTISAPRMMRAFVPGAAAFLVYERFGTLLAPSSSS